MDKSWMNQRRTSSAYFEGVEEFLDFAFANASVDGEIICPCNVCGNSIWVSRIGARGHLICNGFIKGYTKWVAHGEVKSSAAPLSRAHVALDVIDDMRGLLHDRFHMSSDEVREGATDVAMEGPNGEAEKFYKLLQDSQEMLYKDCKKFSRLSFLVRLLHIKSLENVAKGIIQSIDPSTEVGGEELGPNWCEVSIQVAVKKDERLIRSYGFHKTIYDAYGATVAWPCPYVELESVDEM
ncbi:hypothetical protein RJ639_036643 [Escallonia herrerae]|uniref:Transposase n=1 Tax=Escallonia herrerae TaxID=1293975 RepID=A0AA88WVE4_9ASTE|nr:hypothetical protein RJ639_036643 [Escallonia herrerae]